jgi:probable phosphoglycerate mutase
MISPRCVLVRHGETEWSRSHRHTGRTDLPLLPQGWEQAHELRARLAGRTFALVLCSPLTRARETCGAAGLDDRAVIDADLIEWDYGAYEGRTTAEIREERPGWNLFDDGAPGGETTEQVGERVDRVIAKVRAAGGDVACVAHAHVLRVLAARWIGLGAGAGRIVVLDPASLSELGWEREQPVISRWNVG